MKSNLEWHLVKHEGEGLFENARTFKGTTRWLGMDKDLLI